MKLIIPLFLFCWVQLFGIEYYDKHITQKLVVVVTKERRDAKLNLSKLRIFFIDNEKAKRLEEKYHLTLKIETVGDFSLVMIEPIASAKVKNQLLFLLSPYFSDMFMLKENKIVCEPVDEKRRLAQITVSKNKKSLIREIGLEWITLFFLSLIGLITSIYNRRKLKTLIESQEKLSFNQEKIESEMDTLGSNR